MSRFSAGVAPSTSIDVEQPALAEDRHDRRLGGDQLAQVRVVVGRVRAMAGRAEGGEPRALPAHRPGGREELDVLGVRARPAALDERHPELVEHPRDAQLVGQRQRDVLALGAVAQGRVVEDDRGVRTSSCGARSAAGARGRSIDRGRERRSCRPPTRPSSGLGRVGQVAVRQPSSRARADGRLDRRRPRRRGPSDQRSSIAADRIVPIGLATSCPAMSGAEPWIGSYRPNVPCAVRRSPSDADGSMPSEPASTDASSDRMSPNRFSVTMTSKSAGRRISSIAHESTSWCSSLDVRELGARPRRRPCATAATWRARSPCRRW